MNEKKMLRIGLIGSVVTAICCVTPVLVVLFAALGPSALVGWLDYVLFPALAVFLVLTVRTMMAMRPKS